MLPQTTLEQALRALSEAGGVIEVSPTGGVIWTAQIDTGAVEALVYWSPWLAVWYWRSPMAILSCDTCGEVMFTGKRKTRKCLLAGGTKGFRPIEGKEPSRKKGQIGRHLELVKLGGCDGEMRPITPPTAKRRPNRKRVKIDV